VASIKEVNTRIDIYTDEGRDRREKTFWLREWKGKVGLDMQEWTGLL